MPILTEIDQKFLAFLFERRESWISYDDQRIVPSRTSFRRTMKKLEFLDLVKSKMSENGTKAKRVYTIKYESEPFGERIKKIIDGSA